jgi:HlyD family secretion protein
LKKKTVVWLTVLAVVAGGIAWSAKQSADAKLVTEVEIRRIERKDLKAVLSASGKIKPKTMVDVSAAVSGKVLDVFVREGDLVAKGQPLFKIDPKPFQTQVQQLEASIESARANIELQKAQLKQSESQLHRTEGLAKQGLVTVEQIDREATAVEVERARLKSTQQEIPRLEASLAEAQHELTKVDVLSDIAGTVTAVNIEAGEYAFVGAFNNPATVLLTVADLDVIEAEVEVDETEAIVAQAGQPAELEIDAHRSWIFRGVVTEVGHNPVTKATGAEREGTSYLVKIAVNDTIPGVRPGLTCSARIQTDERKGALAVPIQALTLRKPQSEAPWRPDAPDSRWSGSSVARAAEPPSAPPTAAAPPAAVDANAPASGKDDHLAGSQAHRRKNDEGKVEGVFVVRDGRAWFAPITIGITGEKEHELSVGLQEGDEIVVGPWKAVRELKEGDRVKPAPKKEEGAKP